MAWTGWRVLKLPLDLREPAERIHRMMMDRLDDGRICPCCEQKVKTYKHQISGRMAAVLSWIVRRNIKNGWKWIPITALAPKWVV